jgi:hypothetical protein
MGPGISGEISDKRTAPLGQNGAAHQQLLKMAG